MIGELRVDSAAPISPIMAVAAGVLLAGVLAGCTTTAESDAGRAPSVSDSAPTRSPASPAAAAAGTASAPQPASPATPRPTSQVSPERPDPSEARGLPSADPASPPSATSGSLRRATLPAPARLGPGWAYRVDPGSAEEGYVTSGQPATARDPDEVAVALTPFDCPDLAEPPALPTPRRALEVTYVHRHGAAPGVGLVLDLASAGQAATFVREYVAAQAACSAGRARVADATAVEVLSRDPAGAVVRRRDSPAAGSGVWVEGIARDASRVRARRARRHRGHRRRPRPAAGGPADLRRLRTTAAPPLRPHLWRLCDVSGSAQTSRNPPQVRSRGRGGEGRGASGAVSRAGD